MNKTLWAALIGAFAYCEQANLSVEEKVGGLSVKAEIDKDGFLNKKVIEPTKQASSSVNSAAQTSAKKTVSTVKKAAKASANSAKKATVKAKTVASKVAKKAENGKIKRKSNVKVITKSLGTATHFTKSAAKAAKQDTAYAVNKAVDTILGGQGTKYYFSVESAARNISPFKSVAGSFSVSRECSKGNILGIGAGIERNINFLPINGSESICMAEGPSFFLKLGKVMHSQGSFKTSIIGQFGGVTFDKQAVATNANGVVTATAELKEPAVSGLFIASLDIAWKCISVAPLVGVSVANNSQVSPMFGVKFGLNFKI